MFRLAKATEAELLSELCFQSKAYWGYDMDFMEDCRESLRVETNAIEAGLVIVGEQNEQLVCVSVIEQLEGNQWDLDAFFVHPDFVGQGLGRRLFIETIQALRKQGCETLEILSDPQASAFYEAMGAVFVKAAPSNVIPGRSLPLLSFTIADI